MGRKRETSDARQRILETADRLFYQDGVRAVGVDRIIAEAGVAKMSLYKHFPSKDDLILAALKHREESVLEFFRVALERHGKKIKDPLRAFFAALKDLVEAPEFRGCPFQNAAVELADPGHPGAEFVLTLPQVTRHVVKMLAAYTEPDARTAISESRKHGRQQHRRKVAWHPNPQHLRTYSRHCHFHDLVVERQHPARIVDQQFAGRRKTDTGRALVEQLAIQQNLQSLYLGGNGGLRDTERLCGFGETSEVDDRYEGAEQLGGNVDHSFVLEGVLAALCKTTLP